MKPSIWPPIRSWKAGAVPLYGTISVVELAGSLEQLGRQVAGRADRADGEGHLAGVRLGVGRSDLMSVIGRFLLMATDSGALATSATGVKLATTL
jgi:hypothetical protein